MVWFFLAFLAAISVATSDALTKHYLSKLNKFEMAAARQAFAVPYLFVVLLLIPVPHLDATFFLSLGIALPLEVIALLFYVRALQVSPLSLTVPFLAFTPAFLILAGWIVLEERLSSLGILGVMAVTAGGYILNIGEVSKGILGPFRAVAHERGSWMMLVVSLLYSVTAALGKKAVEHSSPLFFACIYFLILGTLMPLAFFFSGRLRLYNLREIVKPGLVLGLTMSVMIVGHMLSISKIEAAYMIAVKRTSILFSIIYAAYFFHETNLKQRFYGALIIVTGVAIIAMK